MFFASENSTDSSAGPRNHQLLPYEFVRVGENHRTTLLDIPWNPCMNWGKEHAADNMVTVYPEPRASADAVKRDLYIYSRYYDYALQSLSTY